MPDRAKKSPSRVKKGKNIVKKALKKGAAFWQSNQYAKPALYSLLAIGVILYGMRLKT